DIVLLELSLLEEDLPLAREQVRHGSRIAHVAAIAGHGRPDLPGGAVPVVRQALDEQRHAVRTVALVQDRLPLGTARLLTGASFARALDVVGRDGVLLSLLDGVVQRRVPGRVTTARPGGHLDVLDEFGEELAALGVDRRLLVFGGGPLGMPCHVLIRPTGVWVVANSLAIQSTRSHPRSCRGSTGACARHRSPRGGTRSPGRAPDARRRCGHGRRTWARTPARRHPGPRSRPRGRG